MPELDEKTKRFSLNRTEEKIQKWIDDDYRIEARRDIDQHGNFEFTDRMGFLGKRRK